ncbi:MAG: hypothetical protein ACK55I_38970, partial [bacterium]
MAKRGVDRRRPLGRARPAAVRWRDRPAGQRAASRLRPERGTLFLSARPVCVTRELSATGRAMAPLTAA